MSFNLTVTEDEIQKTLNILANNVYPKSISLEDIAYYVFADSFGDVAYLVCPNEIDKRKIRLCIKEIRKRGVLIIAKRGYSMAGDDPEPVIHFINGMYSRAHSLTTDADIMYHGLKQKYGDAVSEKVQQMPGQPMLFRDVTQADIEAQLDRINGEPPFRKSIDARGNEIALEFEEDA